MKTLLTILCLSLSALLYAKENSATTANLRQKYDRVTFIERNRINHFSYYLVSKFNKKGACDTLGIEIVPPVFDSCTVLYDYYTCDTNKIKTTVFAQDGTNLIAETDDMIFAFYLKDYIICIKDGEYHYDGDGCVDKIKKNGKWGVFSLKEKKFIVPFKYDYIRGYGEGLFLFCVGGKFSDLENKPKAGKWGYIDTTGRILIDAIYDNATVFKDGYAQVTNGKAVSLISNPLMVNSSPTSQAIVRREAPIANFTNDNLFAVIIGNDEYSSEITSPSAQNDSELFYQYCIKSLGCKENNIRYIPNATFATIQREFSHIREIAEVYDGEAKILFYFSGLGTSDVHGIKFILPSDAEFSNISATGISIKSIADLFNSITTKYSLAIIDAPFNGLDKTGNTLISDRGVYIKSNVHDVLRNNSFILLGSGEKGRAYNMKDENLSLFTNTLLELMDKNMNKMSVLTYIEKVIKATQQSSTTIGDEIQAPQLLKSIEFNTPESKITF